MKRILSLFLSLFIFTAIGYCQAQYFKVTYSTATNLATMYLAGNENVGTSTTTATNIIYSSGGIYTAGDLMIKGTVDGVDISTVNFVTVTTFSYVTNLSTLNYLTELNSSKMTTSSFTVNTGGNLIGLYNNYLLFSAPGMSYDSYILFGDEGINEPIKITASSQDGGLNDGILAISIKAKDTGGVNRFTVICDSTEITSNMFRVDGNIIQSTGNYIAILSSTILTGATTIYNNLFITGTVDGVDISTICFVTVTTFSYVSNLSTLNYVVNLSTLNYLTHLTAPDFDATTIRTNQVTIDNNLVLNNVNDFYDDMHINFNANGGKPISITATSDANPPYDGLLTITVNARDPSPGSVNRFIVVADSVTLTVDDAYISGNLSVGDDFSCTGIKEFDIQHPAKEGYRLKHSCPESNEVLLVYRGIGRIETDPVTINLPDYFKDIIEPGSETIHLTETSIGQVYVESTDFENNKFVVNGKDNTRFTWLVFATRKGYTNYQAEYK